MSANDPQVPTIDEFRAEAARWLVAAAQERDADPQQGHSDDDVSVFRDLPHEEELELIDRITSWQRAKFDAGFAAIDWSSEFGGRGLTPDHADAFLEEESRVSPPEHHELTGVSVNLIAPTLRMFGSPEQQRLIPDLLRGDMLACQLFSEPGAGSDLANLGTRAVRQGEDWVVNGQKVWTSGAQFAGWGELLARTDPEAPKHRGITAFLIPMDLPGIDVRPLRQMSGGSSFNEVFLTDVRIPDRYRLGEVGEGWKVGLTTLGFERDASSAQQGVGGSLSQVIALAQLTGADRDPLLRQLLADVVIGQRIGELSNARDAQARSAGQPLGAIGSIRMMQWVSRLRAISRFAAAALGPELAVDSGRPGTFSWTQHVLGAPGYRIAGGSDEVQRNIIAERLLRMPAEARSDKSRPWSETRGS